MIEFEESTHTYRVNGVVLPSVTQIMSVMGLVRHFNSDPWFMERGRAVHLACHYMDMGALDLDSVDPQIKGFLDAYQRFRDEHWSEWDNQERPLDHPVYKYCGCPDRWSDKCLLDIKTGQGDVIQLEAYSELLRANGYDPGRTGYMLHLNEDGTYKLQAHKYDRKLLGVFLSAVTVWWFRKEKGLL